MKEELKWNATRKSVSKIATKINGRIGVENGLLLRGNEAEQPLEEWLPWSRDKPTRLPTPIVV
jgi:hypothetical protein